MLKVKYNGNVGQKRKNAACKPLYKHIQLNHKFIVNQDDSDCGKSPMVTTVLSPN